MAKKNRLHVFRFLIFIIYSSFCVIFLMVTIQILAPNPVHGVVWVMVGDGAFAKRTTIPSLIVKRIVDPEPPPFN